MRKRPAAVIAITAGLVLGTLLATMGPAAAQNYTTTVTCASLTSVCSNPATTTPTPPADIGVSIIGGGVSNAQAFVVNTTGAAIITSVVATFADTGPQNQALGQTNYTFTGLSANHYVSKFEVFWTDQQPTTTTTSTSSTSSTSTSSTSSTSTTSTSTTSTSTTTTTLAPGPGKGPDAIRQDTVASSPDTAAVRGQNNLYTVVRGNDGTIQWTQENWPTVPWTQYQSLGAPPSVGVNTTSNPTIAAWGGGRLDVFVRGGDDHLWQTYSNDGGQSWAAWLKPFGDDGILTASPELSTRGQYRLNVWVVNVDGDVYEHYYEGPEIGGSGWNSSWYFHGRPPGGLSQVSNTQRSDPGTVAMGGGSERLDLMVRGSDNQLWQATWDGATWSSWIKPVSDLKLGGGLLASEPEVASWEPGNLLVFALGTDGRLYVMPYGTGGWDTKWTRMVKGTDTWAAGSGPGATSRGSGLFDVFVRGTDGKVYHIWQ